MGAIYNLVAPVLRQVYKGKVFSKPIKGSSSRLFYEASQHLGFWGKSKINYEPEFWSIISSYIRQGGTVFDIGANIGQYSLRFSELIGPDGILVSIEPDSDNYAFL